MISLYISTQSRLTQVEKWSQAQWVDNQRVLSVSPIKGSSCILEQETLPLLLSTGWFSSIIYISIMTRFTIELKLIGTDLV